MKIDQNNSCKMILSEYDLQVFTLKKSKNICENNWVHLIQETSNKLLNRIRKIGTEKRFALMRNYYLCIKAFCSQRHWYITGEPAKMLLQNPPFLIIHHIQILVAIIRQTVFVAQAIKYGSKICTLKILRTVMSKRRKKLKSCNRLFFKRNYRTVIIAIIRVSCLWNSVLKWDL